MAEVPQNIGPGNAGPGMEGEEYDRMVANMQERLLRDKDLPESSLDKTMHDLREHGVEDPYGRIEEE